MKTIKIAHLYYDIMNLYGENGNVKFLTRKIEEQDIKCEIHFLTIDDKIDFSKYDIFYIGTGNEESISYVLDDLKKYKDDIKKALDSKKYFIITGNALELFAKTIRKENEELKGLGILDFDIKEEPFRIVGEQFYDCSLIDKKIIGFQNRSCTMDYEENSLFDVIEGTGNNPNIKKEGIRVNNLFATYLLGPLLVRNPFFCDYIVECICKDHDISYKIPDTNTDAYKAYLEYIKMFHTK